MNAITRLLLAAVFLLALTASAAGFRLDTQDARAVGMGGAFTGLADGPSANFYNPAGLAQGKGFAASVGATLIFPSVSYTDEGGTSTGTPFSVATPINAYLQGGVLDNLSLGLGFYTQYGASVKWPENWAGQFKAQDSSLQTFTINPNLAWRVHQRLSIAGGLNLVRGTVFIHRHIDFVDSTGAVELGGDAWGIGYNLGMQAEVVPEVLTFGATWRSGVDLSFAGRAHFSNVPTEFTGLIHDQAIDANVTLPMTASFGFGLKATQKLRFDLDATYVNWSSFRELKIVFAETDALTVPLPKKWEDTVSVHLGAEYDVGAGVKARLGLVYDPTPTPSSTLTPDLPDSGRINVAAGVGYAHSSGVSVDLGFQFVYLMSMRSTAAGFSGTYKGTAEVVALNVGYKL